MSKASIFIVGMIGRDTTLLDVIRQFKSFKNPESVDVHIDSFGGYVTEGMNIYSYLRKLGIPVTTIATKAYSISASIFMAGDTRIALEGADRVMIHFPWADPGPGNADTFENLAKQLRSVEKDFQEFYSKFTDVDKESIRTLLANETMLSGQEALELGLATEIQMPMKAIAKYEPEIFNQSQMTKAEQLIHAFQAFIKPEQAPADPADPATIVALVLQDANGVDINFPELNEGDAPQVDDSAEIDGAPAEGSILMPEGETYVFVAGKLTEILPAAPADPAPADPAPAASAEVDYAEMLGQFEAKIMASIEDKFKASNDALKAEIVALKKLVGSKDITTDPAEPAPAKKSGNYLCALKRK